MTGKWCKTISALASRRSSAHLELKFAVYDTLPYKLLGVADEDPITSRLAAQDCLHALGLATKKELARGTR